MAIRSKRHAAKPVREVEFKGSYYKVRGKVEIPDLYAMPSISARLWIIQHTYARGYSKPNPLAMMGDAISVGTK